jgi:hypothetical protein
MAGFAVNGLHEPFPEALTQAGSWEVGDSHSELFQFDNQCFAIF